MESLSITIETGRVAELVLFAFLGFALSMVITPIYTTLAYRGRWWKKQRANAATGEKAEVFSELHSHKHKRLIPTMAGLIFVVSVALITLSFNLSREQTWLPLAAFAGAGFVGLIDDFINLRGSGRGTAGLSVKLKLFLISLISL